MTTKRRKQPLAAAVGKAFNHAGISSKELLTGQIVHTDLPWQCPPLECQATLGGYPFEWFIDYPIKVDVDQLIIFWQHGLEVLWQNPTRAIGPGGWRGLAQALPGVKDSERALRLSIPEGFPASVDAHAGVIFSMEIAKILANSVPIKRFERSGCDYWVELHDGRVVGVVDGVPATPCSWEESAWGDVDFLASSGRGRKVTTCRYDLLSKVRSVLHERAAEFAEFDGLDWALQALAVEYQDRLCAELQLVVERMPTDMFIARKKVKALEEALKLMEAWSMNDRIKIMSLFEMLVPEVMTATTFQKSIFNTYISIPAIMAAATEKKIFKYLRRRKEFFEKDL